MTINHKKQTVVMSISNKNGAYFDWLIDLYFIVTDTYKTFYMITKPISGQWVPNPYGVYLPLHTFNILDGGCRYNKYKYREIFDPEAIISRAIKNEINLIFNNIAITDFTCSIWQ